MQGVFYDAAGRYFLPPEGVTLATLGVPPYSPPPEGWDGEDPVSFGAEVSGPTDVSSFGAMPWAALETAAPGARISFGDIVRAISLAAEPDAWRADNRAPFRIPDNASTTPGPLFDDLVRTIDPRANPALWRGDDSAPRYAGWDDAAAGAIPDDPRAVALGAVRIPGLPEDAAEWRWHEQLPGRTGDAETPAQLASILERWIGLETLGADFTPSQRGGNPSISGGGAGGGSGGGGSSGSISSISSSGPTVLERIWRLIGGVPGGRRQGGAPASAFVGRTGAGSPAERRLGGTPLLTPRGPARNPPGQLIPSQGKPIPSTAHGMDKVQDQGFVPSVIGQVRDSRIRNPGNRPGTTTHYDPINNIFAVFDDAGRLISTHYKGRRKKAK